MLVPECQFGLLRPLPFNFPTVFRLLPVRSAIQCLPSLICLLQLFCKWKSHLAIFQHELSEDVSESKEHLDMFN